MSDNTTNDGPIIAAIEDTLKKAGVTVEQAVAHFGFGRALEMIRALEVRVAELETTAAAPPDPEAGIILTIPAFAIGATKTEPPKEEGGIAKLTKRFLRGRKAKP